MFMRNKIIKEFGVITRYIWTVRQRFARILTGSVLVLTCVVAILLPTGAVQASANYYDDGTGTDVLSSVFQDGGCTGCHTTSNAACTGTATDTGFLGYTGVVACYTRIQQKLSASPGAGDRMPQGGTPFASNPGYISTLSNWNSLGRPLSPPSVSSVSVNNSQETTAVISFTADTNTSFSQGSYVVEYSQSPSTAYNLNAISVTSRNSTSALATSATLGNSSPAEDVPLTCGTTYNYRVRASNGAANANSTGSFTTNACDPPTISGFSGNTAATEQVAIDVDSAITITAGDSGSLNRVRLEIITNYQNGQDTLSCFVTSGLSCSFNTTTATLTISGIATIATYDNVIQNVQYTNTSNTPNTSTRTINLELRDTNNVVSSAPTKTITVMAVNDAPSVTNWLGTTPFIEQTPVDIDTAINISDVDSTQLNQATIEITNDTVNDTLFCNGGFPGGGSCNYSNGVLTISGTATIAAYDGYIQNVRFNNTSNTPNATTRTARLIVRDTTGVSSVQDDKSISISPQNDAPTANNDGAAGGSPNGFVSVQEGGTVDNGTDGDGTNDDMRDNDSDPESASTSLQTTQTLGGCAGSGPSNAVPVTGFTLDADGTFSYVHDGGEATTDFFTYCVYDGALASGLATVFIDITPVNDIPTIAGFAGTTPFTEQTVVVVDSGITISDSDNTQLNQAQLQITNLQTGDTLACNTGLPLNGITSCNFAGGILTISGLSDIANYETVLEAVRFNNTLDDPSTTARTISLTVRDASSGFSNPAVTKSITPITLVNDRPTVTDDGAPGAGNGFTGMLEGGNVSSVGDLRINDDDPDNDSITTTQSGCFGGTASGPSNDSSFILNANGTFNYTHNGGDTTSDQFTYCVTDTLLNSALATVYIDITAVNDPPLVTGFTGSVAYSEQIPVTINSGVIITDSESPNLDAATMQVTGGYVNGEDTLACTGGLPAGISSCTFAVGSGTLTLTGTASLANYQSAIDSIQFNSNSDNPATAAKTLTLRVEDQNGGVLSVVDNKTINPITRLNDSPTLAAINPPVLDADSNNAYEDTTGDPFPFSITAVASDIDSDDDNNDGSLGSGGSGSLTYSLMNAPGWMSISNDNANPGVVSGNPPITGTFGQVYGPITVRVVDGGENGAVPATRNFSLTVSPPDLDGDMVANYNDFCVSVSDPANVNTDGDGTPGTDGPAANAGGDVCDSDDDDDGMPDAYEIANSFDPLVDDSMLDADGDGVSNLQEFIDGTNPNQVNLAIDATGYLTPYDLVPPDPVSIHTQATAVTPVLATPAVSTSATGPYRPGNNAIIWKPSNGSDDDLATNDPGNLVTDPPIQPFSIRPLASFEVNQLVEENTAATVTVTVRLNGDSPSWSVTAPAVPTPATVNYSVSGTANNPADHNAVAGVLNFAVDDYEEDITFNVLTDGVADPNETVVFTLTSANNAAIGSKNTHTVTILEDNIAPRARLQFSQGGFALGSTFEGSAITIDAMPSDTNAAQTLSCNWSGTDNALLPPGNVADCVTTPNWMVNVPVAGNYLVDVVVTDNGSPARSVRISRILHVAAGTAVVLGVPDINRDFDMDGTPDVTEGYADSDGDGIPDFLDDARVPGGNLIPDQTVDMADALLLETEPGLTLRRGSTTQAANLFGALVTDSAIAQFGSVRGDAPVNGTDSFEHVGGIYDFQIDGLIPGSSARIVIPLQSAIPQDARYRKFNPATGWSDFVVDANNLIASASGELGACPEPASSAYLSGLNYLDNCIQVTIQDGGPNDTDNRVNGVINDPATVGLTLTEPEGFEEVEEGSGGRVSPLLLAVLLMLGGLAFWRRQRGVRIDK